MTEEHALEIACRELAQALAISGRIAEAERRARDRLKRRSSSSRELAALIEALNTPGLRSARDFQLSAPFKTAPRPKAPDSGAVTFHFSVTHVSKTNHTVAAYARRSPSGNAAHYGSYIEREGAAETFIDPEPPSFAVGHKDLSDGGFRLREESGTAPGGYEEEGAVVVASFGNLGDTREERLEFWRKLESAERSPGNHSFIINPFRGADFWDAVERYANAGHSIPEHLGKAMDDCRNRMDPYKVRLADSEAIALLKFAHTMGDFQATGAIKVSPGRGGRVQTRIIAELPHEITAAQRLTLARKYCEAFEEQRLRYWAVIHAPDKHNDRRNFHLHVVLSERPAKRIFNPDTITSDWDFDIVEEYLSDCRHKRTRRRFMQPRIRAMNSREWVKSERQRYCTILNSALEEAGRSKRYDSRSYKDMGVPQKARKRIDPKIYAKERKGQRTEQGLATARQQWSAAIDELHEQSIKASNHVDQTSKKNRSFLNLLYSTGHPDTGVIQSLVRRTTDLHSLLLSAALAEIAANFVAGKMVSRARLKAPSDRTRVDKLLIEVASEIRATEVKRFRALAEKVWAECDETVSKIARICNEYVRTFQRNMFREMVSRVASPVPMQRHQPKPVKTWDLERAELMAEMEALEAKWLPKYTPLSGPSPEPQAIGTPKPMTSLDAERPSLRAIFGSEPARREPPSPREPRSSPPQSSPPPAADRSKLASTEKASDPTRTTSAQPSSVLKPSTGNERSHDLPKKSQQLTRPVSEAVGSKPNRSGLERSPLEEVKQRNKPKVPVLSQAEDKPHTPPQTPGGAPPIVIDEEEARERKKRDREDLTATANKEQPAAPSSVDKDRQLSAMDIMRMRMLRENVRGR
ncbi:MobA/MobL family protein [Microvirga arabica]|uniref:MobA/MobL family protein n=1 Tax=Microvirga arabica TaxID=1128671 RepID=UPI0019392BF3|nr:MobA/MobL family protein [Microvirga arabica]MBM1175216.1 MobA/MobL family protein [Microvirga arabica]